MDLFTFTIIAIVYIMVIHFAMGIRDWFELFLMIGCFTFGGVLGAHLHSYEAGMVAGIVLSLIFW